MNTPTLIKPIGAHNSQTVVVDPQIDGYSEENQSGNVASAMKDTKVTYISWTQDGDA